ncbi:hypothetical protein [Herpetosiphon geysericola]|uniref:Uncharacterized protein n=1 Tax=Herpetosiphon geysericola TaxID=70996 RepID=A0A0P6XF95_9CHLR|nr:hypothetical protein [Herpetosiphon geysericola]KPL81925.1 hypothetical protein SE18_20200 [Herpetosiphon geysericola]
MHCPRCRQNVALTVNRCPNCQQAIKPLLLSQQIPLAPQQRQSLINKILLPSACLLFVAIVLASLRFAINPVSSWAWLGVTVMIAATSIYLLNLVRDLLSGFVTVQIAQLELLREYSNRAGTRFYGDFGVLGKLQLSKEHFDLAIEGNYYNVTYSPKSKTVWGLAPLSRELA